MKCFLCCYEPKGRHLSKKLSCLVIQSLLLYKEDKQLQLLKVRGGHQGPVKKTHCYRVKNLMVFVVSKSLLGQTAAY